MEIYYSTGYETYTIRNIEYEYCTSEGYSITRVELYFDGKQEKHWFQGLLSLPEIIRELSRKNLFC